MGIMAKCMTEGPRGVRSSMRRQHVLDTARRLFVERGFHQTGMALIAQSSEVAIGQIYRDFANKEAMIAAICEADLIKWLEEDSLKPAIVAGNRRDILAWIERVAIEGPPYEDRRMMCEILAEVGHNPIVGEITRKVEARFRISLEEALMSLAPNVSSDVRATMMDFIFVISWGLIAGIELTPERDKAPLRRYITALLNREIDALLA